MSPAPLRHLAMGGNGHLSANVVERRPPRAPGAQFFRSLPTELDEAAKIDGAGYWRIYFRILLPISLPALATTAIFTFIWTWNDFLGQLIYLTKPELQTAPVALRNYVDATSGASWGSLFAMSVVTLTPVFIVFLVGQRYLVKGIATTGMK